MSKISERLTKLGHTERSGFGFGAKAANTKIPVILIAANIDKPDDADGVDADLFILAPDSKGAAQSGSVKNADLWGVAVSAGSGDDIDAAIKAGADFVVVNGESAPGAALRDDEAGKGFVIGDAVSENRSKAIESGPFDFLILDGSELSLPLSVGSVLDIQEQLTRYSRHIFLQMAEVPDQVNLELLRDIGISALIYDAKSTSTVKIAGLRKAIDLLEPRKHKSSGGAMLPQAGDSSQSSDDHDDHDDHDHEDDDWE